MVAVVGAAGGLGSAIGACLTSRGASVVAAGRHHAPLERISPTPGFVVELDVRDRRAGAVLVDAVSARYGRLDGVIDAAGCVAFGSLTDTPDEVIEDSS